MPTKNELIRLMSLIKKEKIDLETKKNFLKKNVVMGLDLSKKCPGIAVLNLGSNKVLFVDNLNSLEKENLYLNMERIKLWLENIINTFRPSVVILESPFISPLTIRSNVTLFRLSGYVGHFLISQGIELKIIEPSSSRAFLNIKPNSKEEGFKWVKKNFPETSLTTFKKDNDKSDAIILALNSMNNDKTKLW